jgi:cytochrome c553
MALLGGAVSAVSGADRPMYNRDVRPILADKCFACHGPDAAHREADLRLDQRESAVGSSGVIVPGKPGDSELLRRITSSDPALRMPPPATGKTLSDDELATLRAWIAAGADYQPHWAYVPPQRPTVPEGQHPIDALLARTHEAQGLSPAPAADRITLLRRVYVDLTGLPPPVEEVERFARTGKSQAWEELVERLLESPHFGERMAMYWLDLVRFADTVGYHGDQEHAVQPYRDYVIRSFHRNKPFDVFTREQLAGDLLPGAGEEQKIASCYNRLLQTSHEGGVQVKEYLTKYESDRIRNLGSVWLGATLGCAECHDHKYDPFTQRDFYRFAAIFADIDDLRSFKGGDTTPTKREPEIVVPSPIEKDEAERLASSLGLLAHRLLSAEESVHRSSSETDRLADERARLERELERVSVNYRCMVTEAIEPRPIRIRARGDWLDESGPIVDPGVPDWLSPRTVTGRRFHRLDLADWLVSGENPLVARVFVNRLWYLFFGSGLCRSIDDFGAQGEWPSHPELLDFLACEFAASGWNVKHLVRLIVTSEAYQRSSLPTAELAAKDPENRWFARQTAFRLPAELIRDHALEVSGLLMKRIGGAKGHPYQPDDYYQFLNFPKRKYVADVDEKQYRRGVYVHWQRQYLHPMLRAFDAPMREECTAKRPISNTPLAALTLLNDPTFLEAARVLAARTLQRPGPTEQRLVWVWRRTLARTPSAREIEELQRVLEESRQEFAANPRAAAEIIAIGLSEVGKEMDRVELAAWTTVCRVLLNLHETITRN